MSHRPTPLHHGLAWHTAGESHGPALLAVLEGLPIGFAPNLTRVQEALAARWKAPGRGPRADFETDALRVIGGLKRGVCLGSPLVFEIGNSDQRLDELPNLAAPRPGHADLAGVQRSRCRDVRAILERASARETAARCALGAVGSELLALFGIQVNAEVVAVGGVGAQGDKKQRVSDSDRRAWEGRIAEAKADGDSLGGLFEVRVQGCPPGLGGFDQPVDRLDARLMASLASIPAIKGVSIGAGFPGAGMPGSLFHDGISVDSKGWSGLAREGNSAGGIEGGLTNGQEILLAAAMKPIPTLRKGAPSVDLAKLEETRATYERSDVCSVFPAALAGRAVIALEIASALRARLGGVSLQEMGERFALLGSEEDPREWPEDIQGLGQDFPQSTD